MISFLLGRRQSDLESSHNTREIFSKNACARTDFQKNVIETFCWFNKIDSKPIPTGIFWFRVNNGNIRVISEICSKLAIKTLSLLLSLNRYHTLFWCFYCWLWASNVNNRNTRTMYNICSKLTIEKLSLWNLFSAELFNPLIPGIH